jgi:cytochrome c
MYINTNRSIGFGLIGLAAGLLLHATSAFSDGYGGPYDFGTAASSEEIALIDIDVMPDGRGAPPGEGTYEEGKMVYTVKCMACHGANLEGVGEVGGAALIGGRGSLTSEAPKKTIESYWPYASTVFDYVKRAMPFNAPGSLSDTEVYNVVAYILGEANILDRNTTLSAATIAIIEMPNKDGFIADPRPDIFNYE